MVIDVAHDDKSVNEQVQKEVMGESSSSVVAPSSETPITISAIYALRDSKTAERIRLILEIISRQIRKIIVHFVPTTDITGGHQIPSSIDTADLILLLVSPDFVATDFCWSENMRMIVQKHKVGSSYVIPILVHACLWDSTFFGDLKPLPDNRRAIDEWAKSSFAYKNIENGILAVLRYLWARVGDTLPLREEETPTRYVNVYITRHRDKTVIPKTVNLEGGKEYALRIAVENTETTVHSTELLSTTEMGQWLEVVVVSSNFTVPRQRHYLFLPEFGPSWVCNCPPGGEHTCNKNSRKPHLFIPITTPQRTGSAQLRIAIYYEKNLIQSQLLTAQISEAEQEDSGYSSRIDYTLTTSLRDVGSFSPRAAHILMNHNSDGTHRILLNDRQGEHVLVLTLTEGQMRNAMDTARDALRKVHYIEYKGQLGSKPLRSNLLGKNNEKTRKQFIEDLRQLASSGWILWIRLLEEHDDWWERFQQPTAKLIQVSRIKGSTFVFPWALVYDIPLESFAQYELCPLVENWNGVSPLIDATAQCCPYESHHRKNMLCPFGFWGIKHVIEQPPSVPKGRILSRRIRITNQPPELIAGISLSPPIEDALTKKHLHEIKRHQFNVLECCSRRETIAALQKDAVEVVYFYCHGGRVRGSETTKSIPYLEVGKREQFGPDDITTWRRAEWSKQHWKITSPLVFINGCHTAELTPELLVNFVDAFNNAYAAGVIGTEITLEQRVASEAAEEFFSQFHISGVSVGQALQQMRLHFLMKGNLLGLAYTPYCSADLCF